MNNPVSNNGLTISSDTMKSLIAGPTSAIVTIVGCQPIDVFTTQYQTGKTAAEAFKRTLQTPYRGAALALGKTMVGNCAIFFTKPFFGHYAKKLTDSHTSQEFLAGLFSGISRSYFTGPLSTLSVKKINGNGKKGLTAIAIYRDFPKGKKLKRLYAGLMANKLRDGSFAGFYFGTLSYLTDKIRQLNAGKAALLHEGSVNPEAIEPSKVTKVALGVFASMIAQLISTPFDVIAKEQRNAEVAKSIYRTAAKIVVERSPKALWRGLGAALPRMGIAGGALSAAMVMSETITDMLTDKKD